MDFKRNYVSNNLIMAVSVSLKSFCNTTRKCVKYVALGLTLKASLGMNHTTGIRISCFNGKGVIWSQVFVAAHKLNTFRL